MSGFDSYLANVASCRLLSQRNLYSFGNSHFALRAKTLERCAIRVHAEKSAHRAISFRINSFYPGIRPADAAEWEKEIQIIAYYRTKLTPRLRCLNRTKVFPIRVNEFRGIFLKTSEGGFILARGGFISPDCSGLSWNGQILWNCVIFMYMTQLPASTHSTYS